MELVLIALCGCTASDVVGILRKKREPFTGLEVHAKRRARRRLSGRLHLDSSHLHSPRPSQQKIHGRRRAPLERKILLGLCNARKDGQNHLHHRARCVKAETHHIRSAAIFTSGAQHFSGGSRPRWAALRSPATSSRRSISRRDRSADSLAEPRNNFARCLVAGPPRAPWAGLR